MARHESDAFVLQTYTLREADKVCVFFTRREGKVRGVARGAKKLRSRFGASLEPLSEVHLEYFEREGRELVSIGTCELIRSVFDKGSRPEGQALVHYVVELIDQFSPPQEPNERVYRLVSAVVSCLDETAGWPFLILYFETWLLKLSGFFPKLDHCITCGRGISVSEPLRLTTGGRPECLSCQSGRDGIILAPFINRELRRLVVEPPDRWLSRVGDFEAFRSYAQLLRGLIRHVVETEIKAERFLQI